MTVLEKNIISDARRNIGSYDYGAIDGILQQLSAMTKEEVKRLMDEAGMVTRGMSSKGQLVAEVKRSLYDIRASWSTRVTNVSFDNASAIHKSTKNGQMVKPLDSRRIIYVMTTGRVDRDGETVDPDGIDLSDFSLNPTVQWNHDTDSLGIGTLAGDPPEGEKPIVPGLAIWMDDVGEGTKYPEVKGEKRRAMLGAVRFSEENEHADLAYRQALEGTGAGAASISFLPEGDVEKNDDGGNHYPQSKLLELTICSVGANADAIKIRKLKKLKKSFQITVNGKPFGPPVQSIGAAYSALANAHDLNDYYADIGIVDTSTGSRIKADHEEIKRAKGAKAMTINRRVWINKALKSAWVLKAEGDVTDEQQAALKEAGAEKVVVGDEEPKAEDGYEEQKRRLSVGDEFTHEGKQYKAEGIEDKDAMRIVQSNTGEFFIEDAPAGGGRESYLGPFRTRDQAQAAWRDMEGKSKTDTNLVAEQVADRAKEITTAGSEPDDAVVAAMHEAEVPQDLRKAVKAIATKRLKAMPPEECAKEATPPAEEVEIANAPVGYRTLKKWAKTIEDDLKSLHKSEQPAVIEVGQKALKMIQAALGKGYKDLESEQVDESEEVETPEEKAIEVGDIVDVQFLNDVLRGKVTGVQGDSVKVDVNGEVRTFNKRDIFETKAKSKSIQKRLTKAATSVVKDATEFLDDIDQASDTPKRIKSGAKHHSRALKELYEGGDALPEDEEVSEEVHTALKSLNQDLTGQMRRADEALFRHAGRHLI